MNQARLVKNSGTTNAIHAARLLMEKHHIAFLDLEKACDRELHELIWYALRQHLPEELMRWVQLLYHDPRSKVRSIAGISKSLRVSVGVNQGSVLSPLLFVVVIDTVTSKNDLEQIVQKWNDRLMQHSLRLNLNKTEFLTTDPHETGPITITGSTQRFKYLYQSMENCVMKLLHSLTQPG